MNRFVAVVAKTANLCTHPDHIFRIQSRV
jgi:hypothetical protein